MTLLTIQSLPERGARCNGCPAHTIDGKDDGLLVQSRSPGLSYPTMGNNHSSSEDSACASGLPFLCNPNPQHPLQLPGTCAQRRQSAVIE